jgi:acyl carrier protein
MKRTDIEARVLGVINTVLRLNMPAGKDIKREEISEWDSLKHIEIMFALEEELRVEFTAEELATLDSMGKIVDSAQAKHAA